MHTYAYLSAYENKLVPHKTRFCTRSYLSPWVVVEETIYSKRGDQVTGFSYENLTVSIFATSLSLHASLAYIPMQYKIRTKWTSANSGLVQWWWWQQLTEGELRRRGINTGMWIAHSIMSVWVNVSQNWGWWWTNTSASQLSRSLWSVMSSLLFSAYHS